MQKGNHKHAVIWNDKIKNMANNIELFPSDILRSHKTTEHVWSLSDLKCRQQVIYVKFPLFHGALKSCKRKE